MQDKLNEYVNAYVSKELFSGSILVASQGEILISQGYGMANYELDVPNTPQTKFRLASITKQFTAMAIAQLQEKGLLNVEDAIAQYLPDYPNGDRITIHHLLTHTAGIPSYTSFPDYPEFKILPSPPEKMIERFKDKPLEFSPGEKDNYSNSGYILLGYIVEKVAGQSYENYLKENIFQPLNMNDTGYDRNRTILPRRASGYTIGENGFINADYIDMSVPYAAGGLYSTVEDLYRWDRALYTEQLLSKPGLDKMFAPGQENYGYGWIIDESFNRKIVRHAGGIDGFATDIVRYIDDDIFVVVLSNYQFVPAWEISKNLAAIVFGESYELPTDRTAIAIDPEIYEVYVGEYEIKPELTIAIFREENQLFARATGQKPFEIFAESEISFFNNQLDIVITFSKNERGEVTELAINQMGRKTTAMKINRR